MNFTPDQTFQLLWRGVAFELAYTADWAKHELGTVISRLEITVPSREHLPLTDTGYCGHNQYPEVIARAGGPEAYILARLDDAVKSDQWGQREAERNQLSLF